MLRVGGMAGGPLLCASPLSGLWIVNPPGGLAIPLSWDEWGGTPPAFPDVWSGNAPYVECLSPGFYSPEHVYAGGGNQYFERALPARAALSETDVTKPAPPFNWRNIRVAGANLE